MATRDFSKYFLYRWRYVIGYTLIGLLLAGLLVFAGLYLPGGLSQQEMDSVIAAHSLSLSDTASLATIHLPYYIAQAGILSIFGVSTFSVKILSLFLALLSAIGFIVLLRRWFKPNIAVIAALIAITTGQFLFIAQSGTPSILYIFWPVAILLLGTQITRVKRFRSIWKVLFVIAAALSLYSPLSVYPLLAIALAIVLHPHLRAAVRRLSKVRIAATAGVFLVLVAPLVYLISIQPALGLTLLGIPESWPPDFLANAIQLAQQYFLFWEPSATTVMAPVFGLGSALIIILGVHRLFQTRDTTRSYLVMLWVLCLLPVLLLNPDFTTVTYVPAIMLLAAGFTSLTSYWYRLFPLNPYARIVGLIPIIVLVGALITSGLMRYAYGYHYSPSVAPLFSNDVSLIPENTQLLVVSADEQPFYSAVASFNKDLTIEEVGAQTADSFVATKAASVHVKGYKITQIITNSYKDNADRLYVYQKL